jgi:hypothetical protein
MQTEYNDVQDGSWDSVKYAIRRFNERMSALEGRSGQISKYSDIYMSGNQIIHGPIRQLNAEQDEFITKDYLKTTEAKSAFQPFKEYSPQTVTSEQINSTPKGQYEWPRYDPDHYWEPAYQIEIISGNPDPDYRVIDTQYRIPYVLYPIPEFEVTRVAFPSRTYSEFFMMHIPMYTFFTTNNQLAIPYAWWVLPEALVCVLPGGGIIRALANVRGYKQTGPTPTYLFAELGAMELENESDRIKMYPTRYGVPVDFPRPYYNDISWNLWFPVARYVVG